MNLEIEKILQKDTEELLEILQSSAIYKNELIDAVKHELLLRSTNNTEIKEPIDPIVSKKDGFLNDERLVVLFLSLSIIINLIGLMGNSEMLSSARTDDYGEKIRYPATMNIYSIPLFLLAIIKMDLFKKIFPVLFFLPTMILMNVEDSLLFTTLLIGSISFTLKLVKIDSLYLISFSLLIVYVISVFFIDSASGDLEAFFHLLIYLCALFFTMKTEVRTFFRKKQSV